ncbi:MAG: 3-deoxy-8-phosphooctulonate synthase [Candidatus Marinimicrobia bacterium]|nr:3-deoxy-8-phosphooctulonate synthase [Candidatus Neomarinimicrobiota bacterium]
MGKQFNVGNVTFGGEDFPLIAGPCVIESRDHCLKMAEAIKIVTERLKVPFIFKSSFDKANRSTVGSFRGLNIDEGLSILSEVKSEIGVPVLTDVHLPDQCRAVGEVVDVLQIPAFLCRQTDLLVAAGDTGKAINIKKGQFLAPGLMAHAAEKVASTGNDNILLTERGASFGYDLVSDMTSIPRMQSLGYPVVFDATHSAQVPGNGAKIGLKAKNIMQPIENVATVSTEDKLRKVIIDMTEKPQGAALVIDKDKTLLGLITEGDLRRCLAEKGDIDRMRVSEIMTSDPVSINIETSLKDTLSIMEDRESQISVLPVTKSDSNLCVGLLRLHDVYQTSGQRDMIPTLAKAAVAAGCDGLFLEVHDNPKEAKSDASTQWPLDQLEDLLITLIKIHKAVNG